MPRYFFYTEDGHCFPDEEGTELPNLQAAQWDATRFLGELLRNDPALLWETGDLKIIVKDETGLTLFSVQTTTVAAASTLHQTAKAR
jgi:hypothetical protein